MNHSHQPLAFTAARACFLLVCAGAGFITQPVFAASPDASSQQPEKLFEPVPAVSRVSEASVNPQAIRSRAVRLNPSLVFGKDSPFHRPSAEVVLNLFEDTEIMGTINQINDQSPGRFICEGRLAGRPESQFMLAFNNGVIAGTVRDPHLGVFQIQYAGNGLHAIIELDLATLPRCGTHLSPNRAQSAFRTTGGPRLSVQSGESSATNTGPVVVDLMVLYTAAARAGAGGTAGMETLIDLAVAEAHLCYTNSQVNLRLNLVYQGEIDHAESGDFGTELGRLTNRNDGYLDEVFELRNRYSADLVCLIVETESSGTLAGIANILREASIAGAESAFSVIRRCCLVGNYTLAHELAHNMGCEHDWLHSGGSGVYPYSHGYSFETQGTTYRTVMAYPPGLQIPYFANPDLLYLGVPLGIPEDAPNPANDAKSLNNTAQLVASFRQSAVQLAFSAADYSVNENAGTPLVIVERFGDTNNAVTVDYAVTNGTAGAGFDFVLQTGTLRFAAGETEKTIAVSITDDSLVEENETINLTLASPTGGDALSHPSAAVLNIVDDEFRPSATVDPSFNPGTGANYSVDAIALQPDGRVLIAGGFNRFNNLSRSRIARLNADGTLDLDFNPNAETKYRVFGVALQPDGKIFMVGEFNRVNTVMRQRFARLNADGTLDNTFDPGGGANDFVYSLALLSDGKTLIGGDFTAINGVERNHIAAVKADGSLDTAFAPNRGANGSVRAILALAGGKAVIGGAFTEVNGVSRNRIARLKPDGSLDTSFDPGSGFNQSVSCLSAQSDGKIVVGGGFTTMDGVSQRGIARLNTNGTIDSTFDCGSGVDGQIHALALQADGKVLLGGEFSAVNGVSRGRIARLNVNGSVDSSFEPGLGASDQVFSLALQPDGLVVVGGLFTDFDRIGRNRIARIFADPLRFLAVERLSNGALQFSASAQAGKTYVLQASTDFSGWTAISTNLTVTNVLDFIDSEASGGSQRFYRVLKVSP
jgi:uncharacterized delta-60 repeat protein